MFEFIKSERPQDNVSHSYLDELEKKWDIHFPDILREYYTEHNRAITPEISFTGRIVDIDFCVEFILPVTGARISVEEIMQVNADDKWIPKTFIPLARDVDADYYYWNANSGKVYYLTMGNIHNPIPVCDSVEEFFDILDKNYT